MSDHDDAPHKDNCPACGTAIEFECRNVTAIKSAFAWTRIELTDEQISQLASGCYVIAVVPRNEKE